MYNGKRNRNAHVGGTEKVNLKKTDSTNMFIVSI